MSKHAFVLLSGGMDSTTCLYIAQSMYEKVTAISVDYGQRHTKEMIFAQKTCEQLEIEHKVLSLEGLLSGKGVMLTDPDTAIPNIAYDEIQGVSPTYVPFRNGTLLSIVAALAQKWVMEYQAERLMHWLKQGYSEQSCHVFVQDELKDIAGVFIGAHAEDAFNWAYPDCTPEFIGSMANAIYTGTYYSVRLHAPLLTLSKADVVSKGTALGVNWENTWSCYVGGDMHCGTCPTCRARKQAFIMAGMYDPTEYATPSEVASVKPDDDVPF